MAEKSIELDSVEIGHLSDICLALWLYCDRNHSIRECHRLQYDWVILITECITCISIPRPPRVWMSSIASSSIARSIS